MGRDRGGGRQWCQQAGDCANGGVCSAVAGEPGEGCCEPKSVPSDGWGMVEGWVVAGNQGQPVPTAAFWRARGSAIHDMCLVMGKVCTGWHTTRCLCRDVSSVQGFWSSLLQPKPCSAPSTAAHTSRLHTCTPSHHAFTLFRPRTWSPACLGHCTARL